jgi:hypothetical protein
MGFIFFLKSLTYFKIKKCSVGWYHIYAPCHWVEVTFWGATALAAHYFALAVCFGPPVQFGRFSDEH